MAIEEKYVEGQNDDLMTVDLSNKGTIGAETFGATEEVSSDQQEQEIEQSDENKPEEATEQNQDDESSSEAENQSEDQSAENEADDPDGLWDDIDIDSEEDKDKDNEDAESGISEIAKQLGFEAKSIDELKNAISSTSQEQPQDEVDEDYKQYREIVDNGGSVDKLADFQRQIKDLDGEIADYEKVMDFAGNLRSQPLDKKESWYLNHYLTKMKGLPQDEVATIKEEFADSMSASMKIIQINNAIDDVYNKASNSLDKASNQKQSAESAFTSYRNEIKENKQRAQAKIKEAINTYRDPDGLKRFEEPAKALASQVLNSTPTTITLPKQLADMFYSDGKFDPQKAIEIIAGNKFNRQKFKHLEKKIKKETFREKQSYDGKTNLAKSTKMKDGGEADPYAGGLNY